MLVATVHNIFLADKIIRIIKAAGRWSKVGRLIGIGNDARQMIFGFSKSLTFRATKVFTPEKYVFEVNVL